MRFSISFSRRLTTGLAIAGALAACSSDEEGGGHGHTPESVALYSASSGQELPEPTPGVYGIATGVTTRVEVRFYDADGHDISDELISGHYTSLTFNPGTFATVADVPGQRFQRDVTVSAAAGTDATVSAGYGHDEAADELTFGPYNIRAVP